jgi:mRNA interferase YafQ
LLKIKIEKSFKKDIERDKKSGQYSDKDFNALKRIFTLLQNEGIVEPKFKRHPLKGEIKEFESIHIKGDWLLIFKVDSQYLNLVMLGKHTQVYKKFK